jgi:hypothetical protein
MGLTRSVTLNYEQWMRVLGSAEDIRSFMEINSLKVRSTGTRQKKATAHENAQRR